MRAPIPLLILALPLAYGSIVFEFGNKDAPHSKPIANVHGEMGSVDKVRVEKLAVPRCYKVQYVQVVVENMRSVPTVQYDEVHKYVWIIYHLISDSRSNYEIFVKGARLLGCDNLPPVVHKNRVYPTGASGAAGHESSDEVVVTPLRRNYDPYYASRRVFQTRNQEKPGVLVAGEPDSFESSDSELFLN